VREGDEEDRYEGTRSVLGDIDRVRRGRRTDFAGRGVKAGKPWNNF